MCLILAPASAITPHNPAIPPGRSLTTASNLMSLPSATKPRSMQYPNVLVSMLPPHSATATVLPFNCGILFAKIPAKPEAPAPSWTSFSNSTNRKSAVAMSLSETDTMTSIKSLHVSKDRGPTVGTAKPSAKVAPEGTSVGFPAFNAALMDWHRSASTPTTKQSGFNVLMAKAQPAIKPAPPTGMTMASTSLTSSKISRAIEPAPEMISKSSKPLMYFNPSFFSYSSLPYFAASAIVAPWRITLACQSLKLPVRCSHSCLKKILLPVALDMA